MVVYASIGIEPVIRDTSLNEVRCHLDIMYFLY